MSVQNGSVSTSQENHNIVNKNNHSSIFSVLPQSEQSYTTQKEVGGWQPQVLEPILGYPRPLLFVIFQTSSKDLPHTCAKRIKHNCPDEFCNTYSNIENDVITNKRVKYGQVATNVSAWWCSKEVVALQHECPWSGASVCMIGWQQCTITGYRLMTNICFVNLDSHSSNYSNWTAWVWMGCLRQESNHQKIRVFFLSSGRDPRTTAAMVASMDEINLTLSKTLKNKWSLAGISFNELCRCMSLNIHKTS